MPPAPVACARSAPRRPASVGAHAILRATARALRPPGGGEALSRACRSPRSPALERASGDMCESPREETGVRPGAHQARPKCGDGRGSAPRWVSIAPSRGSRAPSPPPPGEDTWPARAGSSAEPSRGRRFFPSDSKTRDARGRAPGRPSSLRFAAVTGGKRLPPESQGHRPRAQTLSRSRANPGARSSPDFRLRRENEARGGSGRRHPDLRHRRLAPRGAGRGPWRRLSGFAAHRLGP